jgi:epoxyqueuosine reductase
LNNPGQKYLSDKIKTKSKELGFYACGISKAAYLPEDADRLSKWLQEGKHAEMKYMENHFEKRTDPRKLLENAKSVISILFNYYPEKQLPEQNNYKISKYAYGTDYHFVLKRKLKELIAWIKTQVTDMNARAFVDSAPVLDRAWAAKSGLGWIGKNTCLITKEQGSFFFIGEIITDLELEYDHKMVPNHCGGCTRCIDACPTNALEPYKLDSNKCISYLTIEYKGEEIPERFKGQFDPEGSGWIFGCDICQDVCPWNRMAEPHNEPEFKLTDQLIKITKPEWEELTKERFSEIFKNSPVKRTGYTGLKRNIKFLSESKKKG